MAEVLEAVGVEHAFPLQRMQYSEAMERFGNDRPDTRFGMELHDITDIVKDTGFKVFSSVAQSGGVVKAINAKWRGRLEPRRRGEAGRHRGRERREGHGLDRVHDRRQGEEPHHQVLLGRGDSPRSRKPWTWSQATCCCSRPIPSTVASAVLSALRLHMADALDVPREGHQLLWVVNFPMFKYDEDEKKYAAEHHPFTHVLDEDVDKIESDPLACGSYSYDLVMDGFEVGGGTIRIHNAEEQRARAARVRLDGR